MGLIVMREPCTACGSEQGYITPKGGQDVVRCSACSKWAYNAPRTETGRKQRSVQTTHAAIKPKQRNRILERANGACERCHASGRVMHVGHIISVEYGHKAGLPDAVINDDENLMALCEECNLGQGDRLSSLREILRIALVARTGGQG